MPNVVPSAAFGPIRNVRVRNKMWHHIHHPSILLVSTYLFCAVHRFVKLYLFINVTKCSCRNQFHTTYTIQDCYIKSEAACAIQWKSTLSLKLTGISRNINIHIEYSQFHVFYCDSLLLHTFFCCCYSSFHLFYVTTAFVLLHSVEAFRLPSFICLFCLISCFTVRQTILWYSSRIACSALHPWMEFRIAKAAHHRAGWQSQLWITAKVEEGKHYPFL